MDWNTRDRSILRSNVKISHESLEILHRAYLSIVKYSVTIYQAGVEETEMKMQSTDTTEPVGATR